MSNTLLTPSLSSTENNVRLYSPESSFFVAFFGGPIALVFYSALNSYRLKRAEDSVFYLLATILIVALYYWQAVGDHSALMQWLNAQFGSSAVTRYLPRILALLLWGGFYLMHRKYHRSAELFEVEPPKPWIPATICIVASLGMTIALIHLFRGVA